jgi:hypothetical protein
MRVSAILLASLVLIRAAAAENAPEFVEAEFPAELPAVKPSTVWVERPSFPIAPPDANVQAPRIDGKLDDPCWRTAAVVQVAQRETEIGGAGAAVAFVTFSSEAISVAIVCPLPPDKLQNPGAEKILAELSKHRERDRDVWTDESVELFVDAGQTKEHYFQFIVNTLNDQQDGEGWTGAWNGIWTSATHVALSAEDPALPADLKSRPECKLLIDAAFYWICEVSIPYTTLGCKPPVSGEKWGLQIAHNDKLSDSCVTLARTQRSNHEPQSFAELQFVENGPRVCLSPARVPAPQVGLNVGSILTNAANLKDFKATAHFETTNGSDSEAVVSSDAIGLNVPLKTPGTYRLAAIVQDPRAQTVAAVTLCYQLRAAQPPLQISLDQKQYYRSEKAARAVVAMRGLKDSDHTRLEFSLTGANDTELRRGSAETAGPGTECELSIDALPIGLYTLRCSAGTLSQSASFEIIEGPFDEMAQR